MTPVGNGASCTFCTMTEEGFEFWPESSPVIEELFLKLQGPNFNFLKFQGLNCNFCFFLGIFGFHFSTDSTHNFFKDSELVHDNGTYGGELNSWQRLTMVSDRSTSSDSNRSATSSPLLVRVKRSRTRALIPCKSVRTCNVGEISRFFLLYWFCTMGISIYRDIFNLALFNLQQ
ncbi:hypothetical protein LXL04_019929 [Taraxacum kok-saghyz]